jgi:hypothetical protein
VTDTLIPFQTKECVVTVGTLTANVISANLSLENNLSMDPSIVSIPAFAVAGDAGYTGSGDVTVVFDPASASTSAWELAASNQKVPTATTISLVFSRGSVSVSITLTSGALFGPPGAPSEQGGIAVQTFPFTVVAAPTIVVTGVSTPDPLVDWAH